jgi:NADPH:quinone reductase-like Zn-dependent oxidoreductase
MKLGKAVQYREFGDFDVVRVVPVERPNPAKGEIVVQVSAAGLNHIERYVREGRLRDLVTTRFPSGQGVDFAGVVVAVGSEVTAFRKGQEVVGHLPGGGTHATWVKVAASAVVRKPPQVAMEVAGGLYLAGCTAAHIVNRLRLGPSDTVVISAAAGGVGHLQVQLAKQLGAKVIAEGSAENHDFLRQLHALPVTYGDGVEDRIRAAAGTSPVTAFIDNHGSNEQLAADLGVSPGRVIRSSERRDVEIHYLTAPPDDAAAMATLTSVLAAVAEHRITVLISGFYPFDFVTEAYHDLAQMHSRGKVVIGMDAVESGSRQGWYLTQKARTRAQVVEAEKVAAPSIPSGSPALEQ